MYPLPPQARDNRLADKAAALDARFNRRLSESDWLKHVCGFDIALFDAIQSVKTAA